MSDRDRILAALPEGDGAAAPACFVFPRVQLGWDEFLVKFELLGGQRINLEEAIALTTAPTYRDRDVDLPLQNVCEDVWAATVGVCWARFAVAQTGSFVIEGAIGRDRLTSLAPPINIILVRKGDLVQTLDELFESVAGGNTVIVTGTSRTADIEGILVRGVHGPKELYLVIL